MLKTGMYVRCPIDEQTIDARIFHLGQVESVNEELNTVTVYFHDLKNLRAFFSEFEDRMILPMSLVKHSYALKKSEVIVNGKKAEILLEVDSADNDDFYYYYVKYSNSKIEKVCERDMKILFTRANYNPAKQLIKYELQNPQWYLRRRIVSKSLYAIDNSPFGFKNLLGTRVHLFAHQVDTIVRALSEKPCRLMLADEVGLGKTIEAMAIIKGMLDRQANLQTIIIVPKALMYQWQTEISFKFWQEAPIWGIDELDNSQILIVSFEDFSRDYSRISNLKKWDICIVDETHRLINDKNLNQYVLELVKSVENLLLLSATPILHREEEYSKLLTLLNPDRFEKMERNEFNLLLKKQKNIQDIVYNLMSDLPDYIKYDLYYEYVDELNEINEEINDERLTKLIADIDFNSHDKGLAQVKLILSYIAEFYQIERGIIRHRRAEIEIADIKRKLIELSYEMSGSDMGFYEENTYNAVLDLIKDLILVKEKNINLIKDLLSAVSSSPYAVLEVLTKYKVQLDNCFLDEILSNLNAWKSAYDTEINNITNIIFDVDSFYSKFSKIIDYIDQEDVEGNKKFLIFTSFISTAINLEKCFKNFFGENSTCSFHNGKNPKEMQDAATLFQNDEQCRFMICDESGGEGRNFQVADFIVHIDLPWSPAKLEQRIGRLDRIGREKGKDVINIVLHTQNSVENDLFNIYDKGLNIFSKSLCGMEIAFEEIHNAIEEALVDDVGYGLANVVDKIVEFTEKINEEIEKERYYDLARQLDNELQEKLSKLIEQFTENDGDKLMNTMLAWPSMAGFKGIAVNDKYKDGSKIVAIGTAEFSQRAMANSVYFPPRMDEIIKRSKYKNDILGTFSRDAAIKHENLTFFAPYNPLFDSIITNAEECYRGRATAFRCEKAEIDWKGFILVWNIKFNPEKLYENNFLIQRLVNVNRYLPCEQVTYVKGLNAKYEEIEDFIVLDEIDNINMYERNVICHLGKREDNSIDEFKKRYSSDKWRDIIKKVYSMSKKKLEEHTFIEVEKAKDELDRILIAQKAREVYYGYKEKNEMLTQNEIDAILYGLQNPIYELDSIAYVELAKEVNKNY